jgi:transcriptional regulator
MYIPQHFRQGDRKAIQELIETHALAILVADIDARTQATHVPVVLDRDYGSWGRLRFHLARANPVSRILDGGREVLMIFSGPQCYISPDWYVSEHQVPTWNYAAAHVYGKPVPMDDTALCHLLDDLSASQETKLPKRAWTTAKLPQERYAKKRSAIVGFAMPIDLIEGKWKMNQDRHAADRQAVVVTLTELGGDDRLAVAAIIKDLAGGDSGKQ